MTEKTSQLECMSWSISLQEYNVLHKLKKKPLVCLIYPLDGGNTLHISVCGNEILTWGGYEHFYMKKIISRVKEMVHICIMMWTFKWHMLGSLNISKPYGGYQ